jgi:hypothetical protein
MKPEFDESGFFHFGASRTMSSNVEALSTLALGARRRARPRADA